MLVIQWTVEMVGHLGGILVGLVHHNQSVGLSLCMGACDVGPFHMCDSKLDKRLHFIVDKHLQEIGVDVRL